MRSEAATARTSNDPPWPNTRGVRAKGGLDIAHITSNLFYATEPPRGKRLRSGTEFVGQHSIAEVEVEGRVGIGHRRNVVLVR